MSRTPAFHPLARNSRLATGGTGRDAAMRRDTGSRGWQALAWLAAAWLLAAAPAHAGLRFLGSATAANGAGTELTLTAPAGTAAGDLLVASVSVRGAAATPITAPAGWTLIRRDDQGGLLAQALYYRFRVAGDGGYQWSGWPSAASAGALLVYRGATLANPVAAHSGLGATSTTVTAPSVTPGIGGSVVVGFYVKARGDQIPATPAGTTQRAQLSTGSGDAQISVKVADEVRTAGGATGDATAGTPNPAWANIGQRVALRPLGLVAYYPMEEPQWTGASGEVFDASGNGFNANRLGAGQTTPNGRVCRGMNVPNNATSAARDGIDARFDLNDVVGNRGTISFWYRSNTAWNGGGARQLLDATTGTAAPDKYFFLTLLNTGELRLALEDTADADYQATSPAQSFGANTWVHVAVSWQLNSQDNRMRIFVNGNQVAQIATSATLDLGETLGSLTIGDNSVTYHVNGSTPNSANGIIDEVRVYDFEQTAAQIQADRDATRPCEPLAVWIDARCGGSTLDVVFSRPVTAATATNPANYALSGGVSVTGAALAADQRTVTLQTAGLAVGGIYALTVNNIREATGALIAPNTVARFSNAGAGLLGEYYDQNNQERQYFTGNVRTRVDPTVDYPWDLGAPSSLGPPLPGWGTQAELFSIRWTGLIRPGVSGNHRFCAASDDGFRMWVDLDDDGVFDDASERVIDAWNDHAPRVDQSPSLYSLVANRYYRVKVEHYEHRTNAFARVWWQPPGGPACGTDPRVGVPAPAVIPSGNLSTCRPAGPAGFQFTLASTAASTCAPKQVTIRAVDGAGNTVTNYTGTLVLSTSTGRGDWALVSGGGTLNNGAANDGAATYAFVAGDLGSVTLTLANQSADDLAIGAVDSVLPATASTSSTIGFRDNAFVITPVDALGNVPVAGRGHALSIALWRKDPDTGNCAVATAYTGARPLDAWLTRDPADPGGAAPQIGGTPIALNAPPAVNPGANNLTLNFVNGVASVALDTFDVGKFGLNLRDDTRAFASGVDITGGSPVLTVRPFTLTVRDVRQGGATASANPGPGGVAFARAGSAFQATVTAYRWSAAADANNDGVPDAGATLAQVSAAGAAPAFNWLTTLAAGAPFTPAGGVLGAFAGGPLGPATPYPYAGGSATAVNLSYAEVGSFTLGAEATGYLNTTGVDLTAANGLVRAFDAAGAPSSVVGRFVPDHFALSGATLRNRAALACSPASTFSYMDEGMELGFVVTARNVGGGATLNYDSLAGFAKLNPAAPAALALGARDGGADLSARLDVPTSSGAFTSGAASVTVQLGLRRASPDNPDGPYDALAIGAAPQDSDGVTVRPADLDLDADGNGAAERVLLGTTAVRFGRLRLGNAFGSELLDLPVPLAAETWNGVGFVVNGDDSCTTLASASVGLTNHQRNLAPGETGVAPAPEIAFAGGIGTLRLTRPGAGNNGSVDLRIDLSSEGKTYLRGRWNAQDDDGNPDTAYDDDPAARASFGVYKSGSQIIYQRESY